MCVYSNLFVFVCVSDAGPGRTAWLIVMKSRPALALRMRKTPQSSLMTQPEQRGESSVYIAAFTPSTLPYLVPSTDGAFPLQGLARPRSVWLGLVRPF